MAIASACHGAIDGRDLWTDIRMSELANALNAADSMLPPRFPKLTPYVGEEQVVFLTNDNSWILARSAHQARGGLADPQPEPIPPPS